MEKIEKFWETIEYASWSVANVDGSSSSPVRRGPLANGDEDGWGNSRNSLMMAVSRRASTASTTPAERSRRLPDDDDDDDEDIFAICGGGGGGDDGRVGRRTIRDVGLNFFNVVIRGWTTPEMK